MPAETLISYERVAEVAETLLVKNVKPTVDAVIAITGGRRDYVWRHLKTWRLKNKAERETLIKNAFSENLKAAFIKDREDFSRTNNAIQREEIEILEYECTSMEDELAGLYSDRDALNDLLNNERESHNANVAALMDSNLKLNNTLVSTQERVGELEHKRDEAKRRYDAAEKKLSGLRLTQVQRNSEMKTELLLARRQIQEAKDERDKARTNQQAAEKDTERLNGQVLLLSSQLKKIKEELLPATLLRIKAEEILATAPTTDSPTEDLAASDKEKKAPSSSKKPSVKRKATEAPDAEISPAT